MATELGIDFVHEAGPIGEYFFPQIMGAGGALFDFDLDGDLDVYLVNGGDFRQRPESVSEPHTDAANQLFRQEPDGRFVNVSSGSGLDDRNYGMGVAIGDVDNDGDPDVYLTNYGADQLYLNSGNGKFTNATEAAGIANLRWSASACFFDYDRDGWLDLYVTNYVDFVPKRCVALSGTDEDYCAPYMFPAVADRLFHNETGEQPPDKVRRVVFRDVSLAAGIAAAKAPGLGVATADFNGDGWIDIYVANDQTANFLWINQQNGTFRDEALLRGCANDTQGRAQASMGVALGDVNGDSFFDLVVTHLDGEANALYLADQLGFCEASGRTGLATPSLNRTGFGAVLADFNADGSLDLAVVNGRVARGAADNLSDGKRRSDSPANYWSDYAQHKQLFLNDGSGGFEELAASRDSLLGDCDVSRGLAAGDIDQDGDVDLLVTNTAGRARLYRNESPTSGTWLLVRVIAPQWGNRDAYGAVVTVRADGRAWIRAIQAAGSYLSSSDPRAHFGLGNRQMVDSIEVTWPDGMRESFAGGPVNRSLVLSYGQGTAVQR